VESIRTGAYKGELEKWYYHHRFPDLPEVPEELKGIIG
jgi:hypothetical protein